MKKAEEYESDILKIKYSNIFQKWLCKLSVRLWMFKCELMYTFQIHPKNRDAKKQVIDHIINDIEFGYSLKMIEEKLRNGSYNS